MKSVNVPTNAKSKMRENQSHILGAYEDHTQHAGTRGPSVDGQVGGAAPGYLIAGGVGADFDGAVDLIASHEGARVLKWEDKNERLEALPARDLINLLVVANFRGDFSLEKLSAFENDIREFVPTEPSVRIVKVVLIAPTVFRQLQDRFTGLGYLQKNHYILSDICHLVRLDPDFWIHGRVEQIGNQEGIRARAISESMSFLMETHPWRFGWLEFDLFVRETLKFMGEARILTRSRLPKWFPNPVQSRLEAFTERLGV